MRSGNEPMTARSPLRLRLGLAIFGAVAAAAAAVALGVTGHSGLAILFAVVAAVACANIAVVIVRIRQGPRFQPGRDVPPLPDERPTRQPRPPHPLALRTRERVYGLMMGVCLVLLVLAWTLIWRYSTIAAVVMSAVALVIPPFAAIIANAGPINRQ